MALYYLIDFPRLGSPAGAVLRRTAQPGCGRGPNMQIHWKLLAGPAGNKQFSLKWTKPKSVLRAGERWPHRSHGDIPHHPPQSGRDDGSAIVFCCRPGRGEAGVDQQSV